MRTLQTGPTSDVPTSHPASASVLWTGGAAPEGQVTEQQEECKEEKAENALLALTPYLGIFCFPPPPHLPRFIKCEGNCCFIKRYWILTCLSNGDVLCAELMN